MKRARNGFIKNLHCLCLTGVIALGLMTIIASSGSNGGSSSDSETDGSEDNTYTVSGAVNGLSGTLVLQNNASDDLTITKDGLFTFSTALADGSSYNVTVKTEPSGQNCTLSNGSGTINGANVTNVFIDCVNIDKSWSHPVDLSDNISPEGGHAVHPQVAMDNNGNAIIVWYQSDGTYQQIFKSKYRNSWTHPADLSDNISPDGEDAWYPQVAMDNNGNAIIVWHQSDGTNKQIFKSKYRNSWTHPADLSDNISPNGEDASYPKVAMDNNDNAIIIWSQTDGTTDCNSTSCRKTFMSEYRNDVWKDPLGLNDNISLNALHVISNCVAMDDNENAIIVMYQSDKTGGLSYVYSGLFKSEYRNEIWTTDSSEYISTRNVETSQVAMDNSGNAIIVWSIGEVGGEIFGRSSSFLASLHFIEYRNGGWGDATSPSGTTDAPTTPWLAMDNNSNAIIVWRQSDSSNTQVFKSEYRNGSWAHPADLSDNISPDGQNIENPSVAMADNGNALIVWAQYDGSGIRQVFKSEYRNGSWTHPADLSDNISPEGEHALQPQVAMDNNGNAIIVWYQSDGSNSQIFMSQYN